MKPKGQNTLRSRVTKGKIIKKELPSNEIISLPTAFTVQQPSARPSVEIVHCISYQKFRYSGEGRPGKKYQEKEFMTLRLSNLQDKVVRVVIICTDADNRELIHPNGLVGKDCHDGIYDKEYAVTKQIFQIKIPYLRTERMKTKKNEHKNILGVLSTRASHLPSPYKERCLSQCTDKYTTSREKFDTTKVCLGVIVTVESHQGILNGSLHAISHVVRNASEKTSLSILKLSNESVPAMCGDFIDIFTTEDGPAIEPEKYEIFVTYESEHHGIDSWQSEKYSPEKEDLLYKRVITYKVPRFEPNPNIVSPVEAFLHLECPQSNQYCSTKFQYVPHGEVMIVDEQGYIRGEKRSAIEQDIKPSPKRLRAEMYENEGSTEAIKANLKTKIKNRNETSKSLGTVCIDSHEDSQDDDEASHYVTENKQHKTYSHEGAVLIHHQDPQTGESSFLLDMDASKSNSNSGGTATFVDGENQYVIQFQEKSSNILRTMKSVKSNGAIIQDTTQDLKVVATGYSDTVPANTVLVYTTSGILSDRGDENTLEHVFIQGMPHEEQMVFAHSPGYRQAEDKHVSIFTSDGVSALTTQKSSAAKINRGEVASDNRLSNIVDSEDQPESQASADYSASTSDNRLITPQIPHNASTGNSTSQTTSSFVGRYSPASTSFSSAIPPIRRMLIHSKAMSNLSPWEVCSGNDSQADYDTVIKSFDISNKKPSSQMFELKTEPVDELYTLSSGRRTFSGYQNIPVIHLPEKQMINLGVNGYTKESQNRGDVGTTATDAAARDDSAGIISAALSSIELKEAINSLPTMKIFEIVEDLEDSITANSDPKETI